jgi:predicted permease
MRRFALVFAIWFGAFLIGILFAQIVGWLFDLSTRIETLITVGVGVPIATLLTPVLQAKLGRDRDDSRRD